MEDIIKLAGDMNLYKYRQYMEKKHVIVKEGEKDPFQPDSVFRLGFDGTKDYNKKHDVGVIDMSVITDRINIITSSVTNIGFISEMGEMDRKELFDSLFPFPKGGSRVSDSKYFSTEGLNLNDKSLIFFIPSVIHIHPSKERNRSYYSPRQRLEQTVKQVKSIKNMVPNSIVILLEMSELDLDDILDLLGGADKIVLFRDNPEVTSYANIDPNKNKAEVGVLRYITKFFLNVPFSHCFKFGGRYRLTEKFAISKFLGDLPTFRIITDVEYDKSKAMIIEPVFYSVPSTCLEVFIKVLDEIQQILEIYFLDVERLTIPIMMKHVSIRSIDRLDIDGYSSITGIYRYI